MSRSPQEKRVVVYHEDRTAADRVVKRLSEMGYASVRAGTATELRSALREHCHALLVSSITCDQKMLELFDRPAASQFRPAVVVLTKTATEQCAAVERLERLHIAARKFPLADLKSNRFAQCLEALASSSVGNQSQGVEENVPQPSSDVSRKLAIVQAMLQDIVGDDTLNATMIISRLPTPNDTLRENGPDAIDDIVRLPSLVLQGQSLAALAVCHDAENRFAERSVRGAMNANVTELRRCLEQELLASEIELVAADCRLHPIASGDVLIGRPSPTRDVDISINCRWFSRGERSLHLWSEESAWFIEDLGSTNGCFVGGLRLETNKRFALSAGQTTVEIGRSIDMRAPVILTINQVSAGVVIVSVSVGAGFDKSGSQTWPSLQEDLIKRWVVFNEEFVIGSGDASKLLGFAPQDKAAAIKFEDGFWITPLKGAALRLDDRMFKEAVPLPLETDLEVGSVMLRVVRARSSAAGPNAIPIIDRANDG